MGFLSWLFGERKQDHEPEAAPPQPAKPTANKSDASVHNNATRESGPRDDLRLSGMQRYRLENTYRGSMLTMGVVENIPQLVKMGLENGEKPNRRYSYEEFNDSITSPNQDKIITPIVQAAVNGNLEITKLLIEHGADPNYCQQNGESALADAANRGNVELAQYLLENGANPNLKKSFGTPLAFADGVAVMKVLLEHGADPNIPDSDGDLPIIGAIDSRRMGEIKLLIEHGTDMSHKNRRGETPLDRARRWGIYEKVDELIKKRDSDAERSSTSKAPKKRKSTKKSAEKLTKHIEQCFHWNARCLGACVGIAQFHEAAGDYPNGFCDFLLSSSGMLAGHLEKLLQVKGASGASWLVPNDFDSVCRFQPSLEYQQYICDMGTYAMIQSTGGKRGFKLDAAVLKRTTEMAIAECLSLLKVAMEVHADDIVSFMLDGRSYLLGLSSHYLLLQYFLMYITYTDSVIFIPDKYLDPNDKSNQTLLRHFDYDVNDSSTFVPVPAQLSLQTIVDQDGSIATGHLEFGGTTGMMCRTGDSVTPKYFNKLVDVFIRGIAY